MTSPDPGRLGEVDDRLLLRRHVEGDAEAFGELYRRYRDRMWAVAVGVCGDREIAAQGVQEGFIAAFRHAGAFRGDAAVTTWLHRIVVNACIDILRRQRPTSELVEGLDRGTGVGLRSTPDPTAAVDTRLAVHEALQQLPEGQRLALVLVDMHGFPVTEAAEVLGVAPGTIKSRCARGRESLARTLAASGFTVPGTSAAPVSSDNAGTHAADGDQADTHEPKGGDHDG